jgi:glyoxylate/hydroxypyruvate reductase A
MPPVEVVVLEPMPDDALAHIAQVDPRVRVVDARGWFDAELRATWPAWTVQRYVEQRPSPPSTRAERDRLLATAEVLLTGWPLPRDLRSRAPRLRWLQQQRAGASNLRATDLWGSDVLVTTTRGAGQTEAMAEYVLACFLHFARGLHRAAVDRQQQAFEHQAYQPVRLAGKTVCVVGVGGIGRAVGQVCARVGMRVVGTRRQVPSAHHPPPGFMQVTGAEGLHALLGESTFVAVCCQWTPETTHLIGPAACAAMRPGTVLVNVARGEILDEAAVLAALTSGTLRGVGLDVYDGEFERAPDPRLWQDPRVLITPHVSAGTDEVQAQTLALFCQNLRAYVDGRPLSNVIVWQRGY